ncbi:hypothetical protein STEG23_022538 [Scotinomys teguina]
MKFFLFMIIISTTLAIAPVLFNREKVFRVKPQDEKQASVLKDLTKTIELDFWYPDAVHDVAANMTVDFRVSERESQTIQSTLEQHKMNYELGKKMEQERLSSWIVAFMHENGSPQLSATKSYGKNRIMTKLLDRMTFYILPVFNVDGYIWSWTQQQSNFRSSSARNRMWRKNRSKNQNSTCIGTDLNRNFDVSWDSSPNTKNPCLDVYRGPAPESEKETKAVTNFIRSHLNSIKAYITFHSYSQMLLFPYGYTSKLPPNHNDLFKVARIATDVLSTRYETHYIYGPIASTIYPTSGSSLDWAYDLGIKHTFAFELRDKGKFGFLLPESRIKPACKETMLSVKFIAKYILKHTS